MDSGPNHATKKPRNAVYVTVFVTFALGIVAIALWVTLRLLNSVFFISVTGAFAGALGGAWAAQRIAERARSKDELLKELRATNASILLSFGICNTLIITKRQVTMPMKSRFDQDLVKIDEVVRNWQRIGPPTTLDVVADYRALSPIDLPIYFRKSRL